MRISHKTFSVLAVALVASSSAALPDTQYKIHDDCLGPIKRCAALVIDIDKFDEGFFRRSSFWPTHTEETDEAFDEPRFDAGSPGGRFPDDGYSRRLQCEEGRAILADEGFARLRVSECRGSAYTYVGRRQGKHFRITISASSGRILEVDPI